jgi:hypothetical protein
MVFILDLTSQLGVWNTYNKMNTLTYKNYETTIDNLL